MAFLSVDFMYSKASNIEVGSCPSLGRGRLRFRGALQHWPGRLRVAFAGGCDARFGKAKRCSKYVAIVMGTSKPRVSERALAV